MIHLIFSLLLLWMPGPKDVPVKYLSQYPLDEYPWIDANPHIQGIWMLKEDTDVHNYFVVERDGHRRLNMTYMNRGGSNRGLEHATAFFSEVGGVRFLNAPYSGFDEQQTFNGKVLLRVDELEKKNYWTMVATLVTDTNIYKMKSSDELRAYVEKNMNRPGFYGKKLHFYKLFEFNSFR